MLPATDYGGSVLSLEVGFPLHGCLFCAYPAPSTTVMPERNISGMRTTASWAKVKLECLPFTVDKLERVQRFDERELEVPLPLITQVFHVFVEGGVRV